MADELKHRFPFCNSCFAGISTANCADYNVSWRGGECSHVTSIMICIYPVPVFSDYKGTVVVSLHRVRPPCHTYFRLQQVYWEGNRGHSLFLCCLQERLPVHNVTPLPSYISWPPPREGASTSSQSTAHLGGFISAFQRPGVTQGERQGSGFGLD